MARKAEIETPVFSMPDPIDKPAPESRIRKFASNRYPNLAICIGEKYAKFSDGLLTTDDPDIIKAVMDHPWYKIHIFNG